MTNAQRKITPGPRTFDQGISDVVRALAAGSRLSRPALAAIIGIKLSALYNRLNGTSPWVAWEVDVLARHFGVGVEVLYAGDPSGMFRTENRSTPVTSLDARRHPTRVASRQLPSAA